MGKISPSFTIVYFDASNVDSEFICIMVKIKSHRTHRVNLPIISNCPRRNLGTNLTHHFAKHLPNMMRDTSELNARV